MNRFVEPFFFLSIAGALHLVFFWAAPEDGIDSAGAQGEQSISLMAVSASTAAMVETWQTSPAALTVIEMADAPQILPHQSDVAAVQGFNAEAAVKINALPDTAHLSAPSDFTPDQQPEKIAPPPPPVSDIAPQMAPVVLPKPSPLSAVSALPVKPRLPKELERLAAAPEISKPTIDTSPSKPAPVKPTPLEKPKTKPKTQPNAKTASQESAIRAAQIASGSGGGATAGTSNTATEQSSISQGEQQSLMRSWQSKLSRRIAQKQTTPRGSYKAGRVVVRLNVSRNGQVLSKRIVRSSGDKNVDSAALTTVSRAGRLPKAPTKLPGQSFHFEFPMTFK